MKKTVQELRLERFAAQNAEWRSPLQQASMWSEAGALEPHALEAKVTGDWWDILRELRLNLLVTREYEHLVLHLNPAARRRVTYFRLPHPSGIAVDEKNERVAIASTRNPNQIYFFGPVRNLKPRRDIPPPAEKRNWLLPRRSVFLAGSTYLHELKFIGGQLHANAVGDNAIARVSDDGEAEFVWWPKAAERAGRPLRDRNYLQLNSIAAGDTLAESFFTASTDRISRIRPGNPRFQVDGRGVLFSGRTREVVVRGLTRPHSAQLWRGQVWLDNSGYGELGVCQGSRFEPVARLPGWTRGLFIAKGIAFVGSSRILPRFEHYAPGLKAEKAECGVYAIELSSGRVVGTIRWPWGNQIFAVAGLPSSLGDGFPFHGHGSEQSQKAIFYCGPAVD